MAKSLDISANDDLFFEYRKYLALGDPHKHRHSMIAVKQLDYDYQCELRRHITSYEHAYLLMLKVDLHRDNKELEIHWLEETDLLEMHITQFDSTNPTMVKSRWKLLNAKPLSISSTHSADNPELNEYTMLLVHGGFEPSYDHLLNGNKSKVNDN